MEKKTEKTHRPRHNHEETVGEVRAALPPEDALIDLAELYKTFGDSTRIKILYALFESELCVCGIAGLLLVGLGCAPIYPCLLHQTPKNFGAENSQALMGLQMACAYVGSTLMPPLLGVLAGAVNLTLYPIFLLCITVLMFVLSERVNKMVRS